MCRTNDWQPEKHRSNVCAKKTGTTGENAQKGDLRFSNISTLIITPLEAHHGRETNTVLRNLTKKPSLRDVSWSSIGKSKPACLDGRDPVAREMPSPADTN